MEGLSPSQIKKVFNIDFNIDIPESTIVNWIDKVAKLLRKMLMETPVPSSGYWGYDEIHLKIKGKKKYAINIVDVNTHFIPVARIKPKMGKKSGREVLKEGRRGKNLWINSLVKDCSTNLGGLFRTRSFKHIKQQNCLTHVKWIVTKHVKSFAGLSKQSRKPIPKEWCWLKDRFYKVLESGTDTEAFIWVEIVRRTVERLKGKKLSELHTALKQLESWLPKIIAHQRDPRISKTNNMTEDFHKKYEYYRAFKTQMKTEEGAQRVLDYRAFGHNIGRFPEFIKKLQKRYEDYRSLAKETSNHPTLRGAGMYFKSEFKKLHRWYGNYMQIWSEYCEIKRE